ncbi:glutamate receptor 1.3-like [Brassica napus]|uniref:glutamate receptor 1.3-like n=1 Tax=Brassica napus TaxID=3708 RepID=UPI0006AB5E35|nr:glutamate receptor 1.3-like [Brassica napus]
MERFGIQNQTLVSFLLVLFIFISYNCFVSSQNDDVNEVSVSEQERVRVRVGMVLNLGSLEGTIVETSVSLALSDFYAVNSDYKTRVSLSVRNSQGEPLLALASAVELLQTVGVEAIIGGDSLQETKLLAEIGEKAKVPVISLNSPVSLSLRKYSHLIQATHDTFSEAKGITAFIHEFDWKSVALVYDEDEDGWRESMQLMVDHFHENGVHIQSKVGFTVSSTEEVMMDRLRKLKDLGTTVFVVHLSELVATHLFPCAEKLGMMSEGFAWILTAKTMNSFHGNNGDEYAKEAMEGVVGFKTYIPMSKELQNFTSRWRQSLPVEEAIGSEITRLSIFGIWAHDVAWALARAAEVTRMPDASSTLLEAITQCSFKGLSGNFQIKDKNFLSDKFEIVNLIGSGERRVGFWSSNGSFSSRRHLSSFTDNKLDTIIWPGVSSQSPKGHKLGESKRKTLRVLVTSSNRFPKLVSWRTDPVTKKIIADGFCIQVFNASIRRFNYDVEYTLWTGGPNYDDLAYTLSSQKDKYDMAVGDITITSNRSSYVDFTIPFTELGLGMVAPKQSGMWVFFQPLTPDLWMTSAAFFVLTGIIVWLIEKPENKEFQGSWSQQIGVMLWFGFSTLVYAHREKLKHNLSRFVVTVWVFAVLILTTSYTATLTSMMTVQQIRFNSNKDFIGHLSGSLIANASLASTNINATNVRGLINSTDYAKALLNNSVAFIIDELPYLNVLLGEKPDHFLMVKPQITTNGFGFMFQKGDELVHLVSKEISELRTKGRLNEMSKTWFDNRLPYIIDDTSEPIDLYRFRGLFMITGGSSAFALAVLLIIWIRDRWEYLMSSINIFLSRRLVHFRIFFARTIHPSPLDDLFVENAVQMAQLNR